MPPKAKFTSEEIVDAAFEIVRRKGFDALTARALGAKLHSSPRPIFTVFNSMDEVQAEVERKGRRLYESYEDADMGRGNAFKDSGTGYIRFAIDEPKLFQLFFMKEMNEVPNPEQVLQRLDGYYEKILSAVEREYGFERKTAERLYLHMWLYCHGIAVAIATKICTFTKDQISDMLTDVCSALIAKIKREQAV